MAGRRLRTLTFAAAAALGSLPACTGGATKPLPTTTTTTPPVPSINQGGDIVVAAEGEPACMDWISTCTGSTWGIWMVETNTMPRAYDFTRDDLYKPSILLTGEADVRTTSEQVITYHLNPRAVWSDGQPITSHDFKYTWDQVAHGQNVYDQTGYKNIASVDDSDPSAAVVTFAQPFAAWRQLFGGVYGLLPSHLLEGHNRDALMTDGYNWSGGPWELAGDGWTRGQSIKLVPNPNYWGKKPDLNSVTFRIFGDAASELQAFTAGQVQAVYPDPEPSAAGYANLAQTVDSVVGGLDYDALWFDTARDPTATKAVRQAVAYTLDRSAIATGMLGAVDPGAAALQSLLTPAYAPYYDESFSKYRPDPVTTAQLMQGDGWAKGQDGVWAKGGQKLTIDVKVSSGSARDQQAARLVEKQLQAGGFGVTVELEAPGALLAKDVPAGGFEAAIYPFDLRRQLTTSVPPGEGIVDNDVGLCRFFCSAEVPTAANGNTGTNFDRLLDPTLDRYLSALDGTLSHDTRLADAQQAATILAEDVPAIPLAALPDVLVVNASRIAVEGGTFSHNLVYGPYSYLNQWYLK